MSILKKFTPEFKDYLKNVFLCSTNLFKEIEYKEGSNINKNNFIRNSSFSLSNIKNEKKSTSLKIVSFNIMKFFNKNKILKNFENYIEEGTDIFLLQEVINLDGVNLLQKFFQKKGYNTYFQPYCNNLVKTKINNFDFIGIMIASKYEIIEKDFLFYDIARPNNGFYDYEVLFGIMYVKINFNNQEIGLYSNHGEWFTRPSGREHQLNQFIKWAEKHNDKYKILGGDFNTWLPFRLESGLKKIIENGFKYYKKNKPFLTLDHLFVKGFLDIKHIDIKSDGSDHSAIMCEVFI